jgi:RNA polymerase sigma-70 factor (ECF subfamily)
MNAGEQQAALERAKQGDTAALGELLDSFRPYVRLLVRGVQDRRLQARMDDSDLIQDAMMQVHRCFADFHGNTVAELVVWLRPLALRAAGHTVRDHRATGKRAISREQTVEEMGNVLIDSGSSPSAQAIRHEQTVRIAATLTRLPEDMQQVLLGRHMDDLPYAALAERLGRSEGAVRVLYTRALRRLRELCQGLD